MSCCQTGLGELRTTISEMIAELLSDRSDVLSKDRFVLGNVIEHARAALERSLTQALSDERWLYFRIDSDAARGKAIVAREIAPMLRTIQQTHPIKGWWWLYKADARGPTVRLRVFVPPESSDVVEQSICSELTRLAYYFTTPCYEPELLLFGGVHGMRLAHEFFCADSAFLASWAEKDLSGKGPLIPEGLSLALVIRMLQAAGLDLFERWDAFHRVAEKRTFGNREDKRFSQYENLARRIIAAGPEQVFQLYAHEGNHLLSEQVAFLDAFGRKLSSLYMSGLLECGLREFFVPIILFHWNRLLLPPFAHFGMSHAVEREFARLSREGNRKQTAPE